jgi:thiol-disulfide isomerase/thioredoxin
MKKIIPALLVAGVLALLLVCGQAELTLAELAAQPELWPTQVTLKAPTKATLLKDGKPAGAMLLGAGRTIAIANVSAEGVTGYAGGISVQVPEGKTDLFWQVGRAHPEHATAKQQEVARKSAPLMGALKDAAREPEAASPPPGRMAGAPEGPLTAMQQRLVGRLVTLENGALKPFDMRRLNGVKFYGIMFSAGWCGPCREFAPHLLESYRSIRRIYPEFELVLVSNDHSPAEMLAYMREENMPWPAIKYSELGQVDEITRLGGPGIPCLVLVDGEGRVLAHSFKGSDYLGPDSVLDATWRVLKKSRHNG